MAVAGMTGDGCRRRVGRGLQSVGARSVRVDPGVAVLSSPFADDDWEVLSHAVRKAGYRRGRVVVVEGRVPARSACCGAISTEGREDADPWRSR